MAKCSIWNGIEYVMSKEMALDIMKTRNKSADKRRPGIDYKYLAEVVNDDCRLITKCVKVTVR